MTAGIVVNDVLLVCSCLQTLAALLVPQIVKDLPEAANHFKKVGSDGMNIMKCNIISMPSDINISESGS